MAILLLWSPRRPTAVRAAAAAVLLLALVSLPPRPAAADDTAHDTHARIDAHVAEHVQRTRTPGLAYAVVDAEGIAHQGTWGRDGDGAPVDERTPFLWGSVAKPVTATAVLTLVRDGRVDLDEPVRSYLPEFTLADQAHADRVTVRHLLEHTSAIPPATGATDRFAPGADPYAEALAELAEAEPVGEPGAAHRYDSANYLVLGALVRAVTGQDYAQALRERVLDPLGMRDAVATPERARQALPPGHRYVLGVPVALRAPYDPAGPSYGYLGGSLDDLSRFASAHLAAAAGDTTALRLPPHLAETMHTGTAPVGEAHAYGLGWREDGRNADLGTTTVWHAGAAPGYQAAVVLLPETGRAVVVLRNVYGAFQDGELVGLGLEVARMVAGGRAEPTSSGPAYPLLVAALALLAAVLLAAAVLALRRVARPAGRPVGRWRSRIGVPAWVALCAALAWAAAVQVPSAQHLTLSRMLLWAPDLAVLLGAVAVLAPAAALAAVGATLRRRRRGRAHPPPGSAG